MCVPKPHFLIYSEVARQALRQDWRFVLASADGSASLEVADHESDIQGERLELLTVVRALEALDQPSHVTLFTASHYVRTGLRFGLDEWRANGWAWECFGEMVPIKNLDLWRRIDRALEYHQVECEAQPDESLAGASSRCQVTPLRGSAPQSIPAWRSYEDWKSRAMTAFQAAKAWWRERARAVLVALN